MGDNSSTNQTNAISDNIPQTKIRTLVMTYDRSMINICKVKSTVAINM